MRRSRHSRRYLRTITVTSGKGGVGKTNIVANLAISLQRQGRKVMIFDADLGLCNMDVLLGLSPRYNIQHVINGDKRLKDIVVKGPAGVLIVPASSGIEELTNLNEIQKLRLLEEFESLPGRIDYILIDTGAGISTNVTFFCLGAQEIIVVVTSEPTSLTDSYALIKILYTKYQEKNFKILINNVSGESEAKEVFRRLQLVTERFLNLSIDYLGFIPHDLSIQRAVKIQNPVLLRYPDSPSSRAFVDLAKRIDHTNDKKTVKGGLQFFFGNLLGAGENVGI
ncbi:MAG: MinD/ParA family protein [Nitrospirae bacterium]|nr:MinD/ParA family protein [Nitrospirota bacterium]